MDKTLLTFSKKFLNLNIIQDYWINQITKIRVLIHFLYINILHLFLNNKLIIPLNPFKNYHQQLNISNFLLY